MMLRQLGEMTVQEKACLVARLADSLKGEQIVVLDLSHVAGWCDAFVICSAWTRNQARSIADGVHQRMNEAGDRRLRVEGYSDSGWIVTDWGDIVLHVFVDEVRGYYDLEHLWGDAPRMEWNTMGDKANDASENG
jgi:ribosome-associated protein